MPDTLALNERLREENQRLEARIDAALAILGEPVTPGDYGSFLVVRKQVSRAVKALRGEK